MIFEVVELLKELLIAASLITMKKHLAYHFQASLMTK
jgi:hypothetical protein